MCIGCMFYLKRGKRRNIFVCIYRNFRKRSEEIRIVFTHWGWSWEWNCLVWEKMEGEDFSLMTILNFLAFEPCESIIHIFFFKKEGVVSNQMQQEFQYSENGKMPITFPNDLLNYECDRNRSFGVLVAEARLPAVD